MIKTNRKFLLFLVGTLPFLVLPRGEKLVKNTKKRVKTWVKKFEPKKCNKKHFGIIAEKPFIIYKRDLTNLAVYIMVTAVATLTYHLYNIFFQS
jgi:hypothetical protein